jgi:Streptogramin lyase
MRKSNALFAIGLLIGFAGLSNAQLNLNRTPSRAIGWPQLTVNNFNPNLVEGRELNGPQGVAIDSTVTPPVLYISDPGNNRVLAWRNASSFSFGAMADFVIGQKDFLSTTGLGPGSAISAGLNSPTGMAVDKNGNLYVVDTGNNRILRFPAPYNQPGQVLPDLVIGQTGLSCGTCRQANSGGISASTIAVAGGNAIFPTNLVFDSKDNLWFTDSGNNRVLRYPASALGVNASNGPAADLVLGQVDFVTNTAPTLNANDLQGKIGISAPSALAFDPTGRLYVTEWQGFGRVLVFGPNLQAPLSNGAAALRLMGVIPPPKTGPPTPPINEVQFFHPQGIFMVGNRPAVLDTGNNRILIYDPFEQWPADGSSPHAVGLGPVGQVGYTAGKLNRGQPEAGPNTLSGPTAAVVSGGELFVVDSGNNRLLVFPLANLGANSSAIRLLGQDQFAFNSPNLIEGREVNFTGGGGDGGIVIDLVSSVPHLYIADTYNNRVLGYLDARRVRPGDKADLVIGQPDFQRSVINYPTNDRTKPNAQSLFSPVGLALDANGNLYVADTGNGRVLRFPAPFNQPQPNNYPAADLVIGQTSFTSQVQDPTQRTMHAPYGIAFTSDGSLLVSDSFLSRVLFFPGPNSSFTNGMAATKVFGQVDFNSFGGGTDTNQMNAPRHIATDPDDRLYVADAANNRVLIFDQVPFAGTNARAGTVLTGPNQNANFASPLGVFVNNTTGEIWVTEGGAARISRFPRFDNLLGNQNQSDFQIIPCAGLVQNCAGVAVTQDSFDNLFVADFSNRIAVYFPGLSAINAANNIPGRALAPGTVTIAKSQGYHFITTDDTQADPSGWPTVLADTQVLVDNNPAPIQNVMMDQLTFLMPTSASTRALWKCRWYTPRQDRPWRLGRWM